MLYIGTSLPAYSDSDYMTSLAWPDETKIKSSSATVLRQADAGNLEFYKNHYS